MSDRCQWIDSRLEAYFTDQLDAAARREVESHRETCPDCRSELDAYTRVDALVAAHFKRQLARAEAPHGPAAAYQPLRFAGALAMVLVGAIAIWFAVGAVNSTLDDGAQPVSMSAAGTDGGEAEKSDTASEAELAKPDPVLEPAADAISEAASPDLTVPPPAQRRLYVQDPAGYLHTLDDFAGSVLVLGVVDSDAGSAAFDRAYRRYASEANLRFLGVAADGTDLGVVQFPTMTNRGSTLLETGSGEFVIVAADGRVHRRGMLVESELMESIALSLDEID